MSQRGRHKFNAIRTEVDGIFFASKAEAKRYSELKLLLKAGKIADLVIQPSYDLTVNGKKVGKYVADFRYVDFRGDDAPLVVEDVKGVRTPIYKLKKKLLAALYDITISEVLA